MRKNIFYFILGIVIASTSIVIASNLMANNVTYTPNDSSWGVNNVEAAIDSLYVSKTSNNYSAEEKVVGTWVDGKPVYQKTYYFDIHPSSNEANDTIADLTSLSIDYFIDCNGYVVHGGGYQDCNFVDQKWNAGFRVQYIPASKLLVLNSYNFSNNNPKGYVTIQYTKTTDQAQS